MQAVTDITASKTIREYELILIGELPDDSSSNGKFYSVMRKDILELEGDPVLSLIELREEDEDAGAKFSRPFAAAEYKNNPKVDEYVTGLLFLCPTFINLLLSAHFQFLPTICVRRTQQSCSTDS